MRVDSARFNSPNLADTERDELAGIDVDRGIPEVDKVSVLGQER